MSGLRLRAGPASQLTIAVVALLALGWLATRPAPVTEPPADYGIGPLLEAPEVKLGPDRRAGDTARPDRGPWAGERDRRTDRPGAKGQRGRAERGRRSRRRSKAGPMKRPIALPDNSGPNSSAASAERPPVPQSTPHPGPVTSPPPATNPPARASAAEATAQLGTP